MLTFVQFDQRGYPTVDVRTGYNEWSATYDRTVEDIMDRFHPHFIITSGMPTHYDDASGSSRAIITHVHLASDQVTAGLATGWTLAEMRENVIDESWLDTKPTWGRFLGHPFTLGLVWRRATAA
ncbi:hypothetical protein MXD61_25890 [Frankia sp. AgPm24]|uniref:hypothetical protein n=1 Tax=Frankia sp. AgPm24 TaxID=631128 RepID=UPI00200C019D|nr:hypothetical protein [Frankia sp. AgPm24]MCK9925264.1 hypothetical protein [Frankia sp. AgPm24]